MKKKKRRKHREDDSSDPSLSDDSDSSDDSHYRRKRRKNKKHREKDPIRLCATFTEKLLTTAYKSKIIRFKMDENPLRSRIYFLTFIDSLDMRIRKMTRQTHLRAMILIRPMTVIIDVSDAKKRNIGKRI